MMKNNSLSETNIVNPKLTANPYNSNDMDIGYKQSLGGETSKVSVSKMTKRMSIDEMAADPELQIDKQLLSRISRKRKQHFSSIMTRIMEPDGITLQKNKRLDCTTTTPTKDILQEQPTCSKYIGKLQQTTCCRKRHTQRSPSDFRSSTTRRTTSGNFKLNRREQLLNKVTVTESDTDSDSDTVSKFASPREKRTDDIILIQSSNESTTSTTTDTESTCSSSSSSTRKITCPKHIRNIIMAFEILIFPHLENIDKYNYICHDDSDTDHKLKFICCMCMNIYCKKYTKKQITLLVKNIKTKNCISATEFIMSKLTEIRRKLTEHENENTKKILEPESNSSISIDLTTEEEDKLKLQPSTPKHLVDRCSQTENDLPLNININISPMTEMATHDFNRAGHRKDQCVDLKVVVVNTNGNAGSHEWKADQLQYDDVAETISSKVTSKIDYDETPAELDKINNNHVNSDNEDNKDGLKRRTSTDLSTFLSPMMKSQPKQAQVFTGSSINNKGDDTIPKAEFQILMRFPVAARKE